MKISEIIAKLEWAKEVMGDREVELGRCGGPREEIVDVWLWYIASEWDDTRDVRIPAVIAMEIE